MRVRACAFLVSSILTTSAYAADRPGIVDFRRGTELLRNAEYVEASLALELALKADPTEPAYLFTLAQSRRKQAEGKKDAPLSAAEQKLRLEQALALYRTYLRLGTGSRLDEARAAEVDIQLQLKAIADSAEAPDALVLVTTEPRDAMVTIDDVPRDETAGSRNVRLTPGPHVLRVDARSPGYTHVVKKIDLQPKQMLLLPTIVLDPLPAKYHVMGTLGAEVFVDQQPTGRVPVALSLAPGNHTISVRKRGYQLSEQVVVAKPGGDPRGEEEVQANLRISTARVTAYVSFGVAVASAGVGMGLAAVALRNENTALNQRSLWAVEGLESSEPYNSARSRRNDFRDGSVVGFSSAAAFAGIGIALYFLDTPSIPAATLRVRTTGKVRCVPQPAFANSFAGGFVGCAF